MTVEELKALAYDQLALMEQTQKNIQVLNQEIKLRNETPITSAVEDKSVTENV